jgi:hypothetical protein
VELREPHKHQHQQWRQRQEAAEQGIFVWLSFVKFVLV